MRALTAVSGMGECARVCVSPRLKCVFVTPCRDCVFMSVCCLAMFCMCERDMPPNIHNQSFRDMKRIMITFKGTEIRASAIVCVFWCVDMYSALIKNRSDHP